MRRVKNFFLKSGLLMMTMVMSMAFVSCNEDDELDVLTEIESEVELADDGTMIVEAYASTYQLEIKSNTDWYLESNDRFYQLSQKEGTGDATVQIFVEKNQGESRKVGKLTIVFPEHEDRNKVIFVEQKWEGDYDDNEDIPDNEFRYAIGYGYDVSGEWASSKSVIKKQIFYLKDNFGTGEDIRAFSGDKITSYQTLITGSSISEMTNALAVKASVNGKYGNFKGEAETSFDMEHAKSTNYEYALTYYNLEVSEVSFKKDVVARADEFLTDDAWNDINGIPRKNARTGQFISATYPSDKEGISRLLKAYGTHAIVSATLGGRLRHSMEIDVSNITSSYDAKAFAKASYSGIFVDANGSVDEKFKLSYKDNQEHIKIRVSVLGGDGEIAKDLATSGGFTQSNVDAWIKSVNSETMALVDFDKNSLVPLYELVDTTLTLEDNGVDGKARKQALMDYMNNSGNFSSYNCGTVTEFEIPKFSENGTLIKDVKLGGQYVAQVCNEYIPLINKDKRVTVVYPVYGGMMRMNMGFFIGDEYHKPARVSWDSTDVTIVAYEDLDFGSAKKLYIRGASIMASAGSEMEVKKGSVEDAYLVGNGVIRDNSGAIDATPKNYPLVKIFNNIWTREDYTSPRDGKGEILNIGYNQRTGQLYWYNGEIYHHSTAASKADYAPIGWKVPNSEVYNSIQSVLETEGISNVGHYFLEDGLLGYNASFKGWIDLGNYPTHVTEHINGTQAEYMTSDNHHIRIRKDGSYGVEKDLHYNWYMRVRLIKK